MEMNQFQMLKNIIEVESLTHSQENGQTVYYARQSYINQERNLLLEMIQQMNSAHIPFKIISREKWESPYPLKTGQSFWTTTIKFIVLGE